MTKTLQQIEQEISALRQKIENLRRGLREKENRLERLLEQFRKDWREFEQKKQRIVKEFEQESAILKTGGREQIRGISEALSVRGKEYSKKAQRIEGGYTNKVQPLLSELERIKGEIGQMER